MKNKPDWGEFFTSSVCLVACVSCFASTQKNILNLGVGVFFGLLFVYKVLYIDHYAEPSTDAPPAPKPPREPEV